jgi:hypothetical protein
METKSTLKDLTIIFVASIIISLALVFPQRDFNILLSMFISILVIISVNTLSKKFFAYQLETDVSLGFWSIYYYGFAKKNHFKRPLPMAWLPLVGSLITLGSFIWMPIIEFDVKPRPERISRRHGLYRFTEVTEWHIALIAAAGIFTTILFGIIGYFVGFETFAKLSIFYAAWSIIPFGKLDGTKIFFGSRNLWVVLLIVLVTALLWGLTIV